MLITDTDLDHFVNVAIGSTAADTDAIMDKLRPHVTFGDVLPSDWIDDDHCEEYHHAVDKTAYLIDKMLEAEGVDTDAFWAIVDEHTLRLNKGERSTP